MIKIKIANKITIEEPDSQTVRAVKAALTLDNPLFHKKQRMGLQVWEGMRYYKYYKVLPDGSLEVPRGFRKRLLAWCEKMGYEVEVKEDLINRSL